MDEKYSIIIPVIDEQDGINTLLKDLESLDNISDARIIVVDGDPSGETINLIEDDRIITAVSARGRAKQMNKGAALATGEILIFLHADTRLPRTALKEISGALANGKKAGAFKLAYDSQRPLMRFIAFTANIRVRFSGIPFGDQAIFVKREAFESLGGYADIPLMEDVELARRIRDESGGLKIIDIPVKSSARRYEKNGIFATALKNKIINLLYSLKVPPEKLKRIYYGK